MGWKFLDVKQCNTMRRKYLFCSDKAEIREVFMVYRIELNFLHHTHQVREFNRDDTGWLEKDLQSSHKIVDIRDLCQDVISHNQVRLPTFIANLLSKDFAEKFGQGWNAFFNCHFCNILRGLDP